MKECFVPNCKINSIQHSEKIFFYVPKSTRAEWCESVGVDFTKANVYCCEDHFDLQKDVKHWYVQPRERHHLHPHVVPHKNLTQQSNEELTEIDGDHDLLTQEVNNIPNGKLSLKQKLAKLNSDLTKEKKDSQALRREVNRWKLRVKSMKLSRDNVSKKIEVIQRELNVIRESATTNRDFERIERDAAANNPEAIHLLDQIKKYISSSKDPLEYPETDDCLKFEIKHEVIDIKSEPEY